MKKKPKAPLPEEIRTLYPKALEGWTKPVEFKDTGDWYFRDPQNLLYGPFEKDRAKELHADFIAEAMFDRVSDIILLQAYREAWPPDIRRAIDRIFAEDGD